MCERGPGKGARVLNVHRGFQSPQTQAAESAALAHLDVVPRVGSRCVSLHFADRAAHLARRHGNGRSVDRLAAASSSICNRTVLSTIVPTMLLYIRPVQLQFGTVLVIRHLGRVSDASHTCA